MKILHAIFLSSLLAIGIAGCDDNNWEDAGDNIEDAAEDTGDAMEDTAEDTGDAIEDACDEATGENC